MAEDGEPKNDDVAMGSSDEDEDYNPGEWRAEGTRFCPDATMPRAGRRPRAKLAATHGAADK